MLPLHPRTQKYVSDYGIELKSNIQVVEPLGYLDMVRLMSGCNKIATDSGGVQKEAFFLGKPCITMRDQTEWVETVQNGWNVVVGADKTKILRNLQEFNPTEIRKEYFGQGNAAELMIDYIVKYKA